MDVEVEVFFHDRPQARQLFLALREHMDRIGPTRLAATKSRVSFVARTRFCWVHEAGLDHIWLAWNNARPIDSPRLRSGARGNKWSHHTKIRHEDEMDVELLGWLREAYLLDAEQ